MSQIRLIHGAVPEAISELEDDSVHCVITSPPYWSLRSYLPDDHADKEKEIGLEPTPTQYIERLVQVFREVRRVLRKDGTFWLNMGDVYYATRWGGGVGANSTINGQGTQLAFRRGNAAMKLRGGKSGNLGHEKSRADAPNRSGHPDWLKDKDLVGLPWMLAFALRADGWYLRAENIWHKKNPMPSSVRDRPTVTHEHVFLLAKSRRYWYDYEALLEPASPNSHARAARGRSDTHKYADGGPMNQTIAKRSPVAGRIPGVNPKSSKFGRGPGSRVKQNASMSAALVEQVAYRNKRSVWTFATQPHKGTHYATFPEELVRICLLAGCPLGGVVLDPFAGSGTVGVVASRFQRDAILIELDQRELVSARRRIEKHGPLLVEFI